RAAGIPARVHAGLIQAKIMQGIFPSFAFALVPEHVCHSWVELELDGEWKPVDSYINDRLFYQKALKKLHSSGETTSFSISESKGPSSCEFNYGDVGFVQMGAVVEDHGAWEDFSDYMATKGYIPLDAVQQFIFPLMAWICNRNVKSIRLS
ncbi:MAG: transglutaminase domain-containing protein, partial [Anaerolineales bacterium]